VIEFAPESPKLTYDDAVLYCQFLDYDGYTDWRMPTFEECKTYQGTTFRSLNYLVWWQSSREYRITESQQASVIPVRDI
jgi:hypothetical protein